MPVEWMHATMGLVFLAIWAIIGQFLVYAPDHPRRDTSVQSGCESER